MIATLPGMELARPLPASGAVPSRSSGVAARPDRDTQGQLLLITQALSKAVSFSEIGSVDVPVLMPLPWGPDRRHVIDETMRAAAGA